MKILIILILLSLSFPAVSGTRKRTKVRERAVWNKLDEPRERGFSLRSVGIAGSVYTPDMSYWNQQSLIRYWDQKFDKAPLVGANLELGIGSRFVIRAEGGYASMTARQSMVAQELGGGSMMKKIDMLPLNGLFLVNLTRDALVTPYIGGGLGSVMVNSTNEQFGSSIAEYNTTSKSTAIDMLYYGVGGIRYPAGDFLSVGAELRGAFGSYIENDTDTHNVVGLKNISLNGLQVMLTLNYVF
jgi:hypothetical protein